MRRIVLGLFVGLQVALLGAGVGLTPLGDFLETRIGLPWLFGLRGPVESPSDVVVVAIDGRTGTELGLPALPREWPRSVHGDLVTALHAAGARVIAFDIHFGVEKDAASDAVFVDAVSQAGNVVLVERLSGKRQPIADRDGRHVGMMWSEQLLPPFERLAAVAAGLATFPLPKVAAAVNEFWVFKESTDRAPTLPAVALQLAARGEMGQLLQDIKKAEWEEADGLPTLERAFSNGETLRDFMQQLRAVFQAHPEIRDLSPSPDDPSLQLALRAMYGGNAHNLLNFYGPPGTILTVPYHAVLKGGDPNVSPEQLDFSGKAVFVGYSDLYDPGQPDRFYTVYTRSDGVDLSGVEIAATAYANLRSGRPLRMVSAAMNIGTIAVLGILLGLVAFSLPAIYAVALVLLLLAAYVYGAADFFGQKSLVLPFALPLLVQAPFALFLGLFVQYVLEKRRGERISSAINYYLPDEIARDLAENRLDPGRLNQVCYATCLATDMAGFSTIAEQLPPGELASFLNQYFETLAAPLKQHGVHVTEFRADAIMCAWTAEQASVEPRRKAVLAALDAANAIREFKDHHDMPAAKLRIGLEAGFVYVGHAGGGGRFVYSIVGDSANTASRVEGLNKHVGTEILATAAALEGLDDLLARYLGDFQFVGKTEALPVYQVLATLALASCEQKKLCDAFSAALHSFQCGDWAEAAARLERVLEAFPGDGPSAFYLERARGCLAGAPLSDPRIVRMDAK